MSFPFIPSAPPIIVSAKPSEPTKFEFAPDFFDTGAGVGATSVWVANPNNFWVMIHGSKGTYEAVTHENGTPIPPGFVGPFGTRKPNFLSVMSVTFQDQPAGTGEVRFTYGGGD